MNVWIHECGGEVVWDLSGGFCTRCHAENLDAGDEDVLAVREVQAAAGECSRIARARITYILDDGTEFYFQEVPCRPGQTLSFAVPVPGDIEMT